MSDQNGSGRRLYDTALGLVDANGLRRLRAALAEHNRSYPATMTEIPTGTPSARALVETGRAENPPVRAWRSSTFLAQLYQEPGKPAHRLTVCRARLDDDGRFSSDISWDELQRVKSECGFGAYESVEIFPPDDRVVNVQNLRHLWILEYPSGLCW